MDSLTKIVFPQAFSVEFEDVPATDAALRDNEIEVKTRFSLISPGTELALYMGTHVGLNDPNNHFAKYPFYPGYAAVGTVTAVGEAVEDLQVGDEVYAIYTHASAARLFWSPSEVILKLPEGGSPKLAVFTRLAAISATASAVAPTVPDEKVVVFGGGMIGNLAAQVYAMEGADVLVVEPVAERRELAARCGLTAVASAAEVGFEPDVVVEATGVPQLTNTALELVRRRGRVVLLGSPRGTVEMRIYQDIHAKGVQLMGAHEGLQGFDGLPSRVEISRRILAGIVEGKIRVEPLLTDVMPASEAGEAYEKLRRQEALGVLLGWE